MQIVLFESEPEKLYPITLTRALFDITVGGYNLYDLVKDTFGDNISFIVRAHIQDCTDEKYENRKHESDVLFINSRIVPSSKQLAELKDISEKNEEFVIREKGIVLAAKARNAGLKGYQELTTYLDGFSLKEIELKLKILEYPWDVIKYNPGIIEENLSVLSKRFDKKTKGLFVGKDVKIAKSARINTEKGTVIIDDNTMVKDLAYIEGPVYIGKDCTIIEMAQVKQAAVIRDVCKVGGEYESSVMESYSNKQHFGYIGNAYLGSWVNIGAGTTNSDLKNTYGEIKVVYNGETINTGMQFLGCVIGDYSKTAINTSILTGKMIGVNSHLYGVVSSNVPSFTNYAKSLGSITEFYFEAALKTHKNMFARRGLEQQEHHKLLLRQVYELTSDARKKAGVSEGKICFGKNGQTC